MKKQTKKVKAFGNKAIFPIGDMRKVYEASDKIIHLVKDRGVYFCSDTIVDSKRVCCYAEGMNPDIGDDWYDLAVCMFGGDDFVENFSKEMLSGDFKDAKFVGVEITEGYLNICLIVGGKK